MTTQKTIISTFLILILAAATVLGESELLSTDEQLEIIALYKLATEGGQGISSEALSVFDPDTLSQPIKCATPAVINYISNLPYFDKDLVSQQSLTLAPRPNVTTETFDSPGGFFKIHFTRSGSNAVYQPGVTTGGVPNFVLGVARVCDSVFDHQVNTLGYPVPPSDGFYPEGVDSLYDIYLVNLLGSFYGLTYPDSGYISGPTFVATSFIVIDNDYQESGFSKYHNNPLDAVRVTLAHEFFHSIHFAIDATEMEEWNNPTPALRRPYWFEISAVWMEEEIYDDINDYYPYLPAFFNDPLASIQQFNGAGDFHPYAAGIFAIFLDEKFGADIIKYIWLRSGAMGPGPHVLEAMQQAIDSATAGAENFRSIFGEFALWNYFTGSRAANAPTNMGFSEREFYPAIPDSAMNIIENYPISVSASSANSFNPEPNGVAYFKLENTRAISYDSCAGGMPRPGVPSDSILRVPIVFGNGTDSALPQGWHVYQINQSDLLSFEYTFTDTTFPDDVTRFVRIANPRQYRSITFALAPASWKWEPYTDGRWDSWYGYLITGECLVDSLIDTVLTIDTKAINVEASILYAYPNPAVIKNMSGQDLRFKFKVPTDSISQGVYSSPFCEVDIYTMAGEYIATIDTVADPNIDPNPYNRTVDFEVGWNMKTEVGTDISSGVYICLARLYSSPEREELLAENRAKVLVVR